MVKFNINKVLATFVILITAFALNGCGTNPQNDATDEPIEKTVEENIESKTNDELIARIEELEKEIDSTENEKSDTYDFYVEDRYLMLNGERFFGDKLLIDWIDEGGDDYNAGIWLQREEGDYIYVYFSTGQDCGGCGRPRSTYVAYKKGYKGSERRELNTKDDDGNLYALFERGNLATLLSPKKTKIAFVGVEDMYYDDGKQTIYIYDFNTEKVEAFMELPVDKKAAWMTPSGFIFKNDNDMYWDLDTGELIVNL